MVNIRKIKEKLNIQDYLYASFNMSSNFNKTFYYEMQY